MLGYRRIRILYEIYFSIDFFQITDALPNAEKHRLNMELDLESLFGLQRPYV
jgi:hypothetical protein